MLLIRRSSGRVLCWFCLLFSEYTASAQERIATPQIINYSSDQYKGGFQNWSAAQDKKGVMYFGNNEGLLSFDGRYWNLFPLPNHTVIRSVAIDSKNKIFVGGQDELGFFVADSIGVLRYQSLVPLINEKEREFADVWDIEVLGAEVFFRTNSRIFHYHGGKMTVDKVATTWQYMGQVDGKLFAQAYGQGILRYEDGFWKPVATHEKLESSSVSGILPYSADTLLVTTLKQGLFYLTQNSLIPKPTLLDPLFFGHRIYCATRISPDWYALGTTSAGVLLIDRKGNLIRQFLYGGGLQKNNIRDVYVDKNKDLWLALDDGIDFVGVNSAIRYINPDKDNPISSYALRVFGSHLYIATSNGLYASKVEAGIGDLSLSSADFLKIPGTEGQVWSFSEINGSLLAGHEDGAFELKGKTASHIYSSPGTWLFKPLSRVFPSERILAGTYTGLQLLNYKNGLFADGGRIEGPNESWRFIHYDDQEQAVWVSHPYRGVFRFVLSEDSKQVSIAKSYGTSEGLETSLYNYLFVVRNRILLATPNGIFEHDSERDRFVPSSLLYEPLKGLLIQYLYEDKYGKVWFVSHKRLGVIDLNTSSGNKPYTLTFFPELNGKILGGFESVYTLDNDNVFVGADKGAIHLNYNRYMEGIAKPDVMLSMVRGINTEKEERTLWGGHYGSGMFSPKLGYKENSFHFSFSTSLYDQQPNVEFSYMLEGFDGSWSAWNNKSEKEYTNLSPGRYHFKVRSRSSDGNESDIESYSFTILPPIYAHPVSLILYIILAGWLLYWIFKRQKLRLQKNHDQELYLRQLELDRSEKEVVRLKNEKLEAEINFKNRELAGMTMNLVQRGEVLAKIKENILSVVKRQEVGDSSINFRQLVRLIRSAERTNEDWEHFSKHFNHVNEVFFSNLKKEFPDLTPNELKLCAFIRMNLSSKEIAQLMNITIKAVEVGRYRLRKKLRLRPDNNLYDFLLGFSKN